MKDTLDLFSDHLAPKPATMLELVAMPGIKLSPTQRAFKQLVQKIEAIEQQLLEVAGLADVFRPLFDKTLQPLQEQQDKVNREMVLFLDAQLQLKGWFPELEWAYGYPFALGLMLISVVVPFAYFKSKGWLE